MPAKYTLRTQNILSFAETFARSNNNDKVRPEHVLYAFLKEGGGIAAKVLNNCENHKKHLKAILEKSIVPGATAPPPGKLPYAASTEEVFASAHAYAKKFGQGWVGSEHLLYGLLLQNGKSVTQVALRGAGIETKQAREMLHDVLGLPPLEIKVKLDLYKGVQGVVQIVEVDPEIKGVARLLFAGGPEVVKYDGTTYCRVSDRAAIVRGKPIRSLEYRIKE